MRFEQFDQRIDALRHRPLVRGKHEVGFGGGLVGGRDAREVRQFAPIREGVVAVAVPLAADLDRGREMHDQEAGGADAFGGLQADLLVGGDERPDADQSGVVENLRNLDAAPRAAPAESA